MTRRSSFESFLFAPCWVLGVLLFAASCRPEEKTPGQLVVSIDSDMALPDQVDSIRIEVLVRGALHFGLDNEVGERGLLLPATLTLVGGEDPATPVTVRVIGKKGSRARTLRETTTTIPEARVASLPMPVQWLCDDRVKPGENGAVLSTCDENYTCSGGRCVEKEVPEPALGDYAPEAVFGGAAVPEQGSCFDTLGCMLPGSLAEADADCTIEKPRGGRGINVALRVVNDGICDPVSAACFVPLLPENDDGFRDLGDRLGLPAAVCERLSSGRVSAIVVSTHCETRTPSSPACGSWSSVKVEPSVAAPASSPIPAPKLAQSLAAKGTSICCPLFADAERFYSCSCENGVVSVLAFGPKLGMPQVVAKFTPRDARTRYSTAFDDETLYWLDREMPGQTQGDVLIQATSFETGSTRTLGRFTGDFLKDAVILTDSSDVYMMAPMVGQETDQVQIVAASRSSGQLRFLPTGSPHAGLHFAQDDDSLFISSLGPDAETRIAKVERVSKADGRIETISEIPVGGGDNQNSGYIGLHLANEKLYVVSSDPLGDGTAATKLLVMDKSGDAEVLYSQPVDHKRGQLQPLGIADGVVLLARIQKPALPDATEVQSGTLLLVPEAGGAPRIAAEFPIDAPFGDLQAPAFDQQALYWLNTSGNLYSLNVAALEFP